MRINYYRRLEFWEWLLRGFKFFSLSMRVAFSEIKLIIYPITLFLINLTVILIFSSILKKFDEFSIPFLFCIYLLYTLITVVEIFFTVSAIYGIYRRVVIGKVSIQEGISFSLSNLKNIFSYTVVVVGFSMLVNLIRRVLSEFLDEIIGDLFESISEGIFGYYTFFILPAMVIERLNLRESFKKSKEVIKENFGDTLFTILFFSLFKRVVFSVVIFLLIFLVFFLNGAFDIRLSTFYTIIEKGIPIYFVIHTILNSIFYISYFSISTLIYLYAETGLETDFLSIEDYDALVRSEY